MRQTSALFPLFRVAVLAYLAAMTGVSCSSSRTVLPVSFDGASDRLAHTVVVPTLDTPAPTGKNIIWCASFQMAWDRLRDDVIRQPLKVDGAQAVADRLNAGKTLPTDLPPGSFYTIAGKLEEGICERIISEMAAQFPSVTPVVKDLPARNGLLAYSYLTANVKFTIPYFDRKTRDVFVDSAGHRTPVSTFGLFEAKSSVEANDTLAEQLGVLYAQTNEHTGELEEFVLDLCKTSRPSQIVVACVESKGTLGATVAALEQKLSQWKAEESQREFAAEDELAVPNINWKIAHNSAELEGCAIKNPGWTSYTILQASQTIEFRLDKSGANMASESKIYLGCIPRRFMFTRPFLIMMKVRGKPHPYFVMWVDNAELLCKTGPTAAPTAQPSR